MDILKEYKLLDRADRLYLYGKYEKAINLYENLLSKTKNDIVKFRIHFKLGKAYYFVKRYKDSKRHLLYIVKDNPKFSELVKDARFFLAGIYEYEKDYKNAINTLIPLGKKRDYYSFLAARKIEKLIFKHEELKRNYNLIDFYITQRDYKKALEIIDILLKEGETEELLYIKAKLLFNKRRYKESLSIFEKLLKTYKDSKYKNSILYYKATILSYMNRLDEALVIYNSLPLSPSVIFKRAYIYGKKGEKEKKLKEYELILKKFPLSYQVTYVTFMLGQYYESKGDFEKAIKYYKFLVEKYPASRLVDDAMYKLIFLYNKIGKSNDVKKLKLTLINTHPLSVYSYYFNNYKLNFTKDIPLSADRFFGEIKEEDKTIFKDIYLLFKNKMYEDVYYEAKALYNKGERSLFLLYILSISSEEIGKYYDSMKFRETIYYYLRKKDGGVPYSLVKFIYPKFYNKLVTKETKGYKIDPLIIFSIMREESRFGKNVLSPSYAIGLMQIIPSTGKWIASKLKIEDFDAIMLFNPDVNIKFGVWYVSYLDRLFSGNIDAIFASYNGGPGNGKKWFKDIEGKSRLEIIENNIRYSESKEYVKKCLSSYYTYKNLDLYSKNHSYKPINKPENDKNKNRK